jgi:hypothetical protein
LALWPIGARRSQHHWPSESISIRPVRSRCLIPLGPCQRLGSLKRLFTRQHVGPQPAGGNVLEIEKLRGSTVWKSNFITSGAGYHLMFDDADAVGHAGYIAGF